MRVLISILILAAAAPAHADHFPFESDILDRQAELPCAEKVDSGRVEYRMTFDKNGRLATRKDNGGATTTYVTDGKGRVVQATTVLGHETEVTKLVRDREGRITSFIKMRGGHELWRIDSSYDASGTKTSTTPGNKDGREVYTVADGHVIKAVRTTGPKVDWTAQYTYDKSNKLIRIVRDERDATYTDELAYDSKGRLVRQTHSRTKDRVAGDHTSTREFHYTCVAK
jgi:YD repeat-containing protein